jgi:hypothetical protein
MLQAYFDESGHHATGPQQSLMQLTVGGCIASNEQWDAFKLEWQEFLDRHSIRSFHRNLYANRELHKVILDDASQIVLKHEICGYGFTIFVPKEHRPKKPKQLFQIMYDAGAVDATWHAAQHAKALSDKIDLVFAHHKDFSEKRLSLLFGEFQSIDPELNSIAQGGPQDLLPLQAADFLAYEAQIYHRSEIMNDEEAKLLHPALRHAEWTRWTNGAPVVGRRLYLSKPLPRI